MSPQRYPWPRGHRHHEDSHEAIGSCYLMKPMASLGIVWHIISTDIASQEGGYLRLLLRCASKQWY